MAKSGDRGKGAAASPKVCINEVLTDDELRAVLWKLQTEEERDGFGLVCKRWLRLQSSERRRLRARAGPAMLRRMAERFSGVVEMDLSQSTSRSFYPGLTDSDLSVVAARFWRLVSLDLKNCKGISDAGMIALGNGLPSLQVLDVSGCRKLTDTGLIVIAQSCSNLRGLHLCGCKLVTDELLLALSRNCPRLEELGLSGCHNVTDSGLSTLVNGCRRLRFLDLSKCSMIGDEGVSQIARSSSSSLRTLKLMDCLNVSEQSIYALANSCESLETLVLGGCRNVSEESVKAIVAASSSSIKNLRVDWCLDVGDSAVRCILSRCRSLAALDISCCDKVTDAAFLGLGAVEFASSLKSDCHNLSPSRPSTVTSFRSIGQLRSNSIQRFRKQMQRVWKRTPGSSREQGMKMGVNLEAMANQKRQWYQIHSQSQGYKQQKEPISLFEHFFIVGLHSCSNLEAIEDTFAKRKTWEAEMEKSEIFDPRKLPYRGRPSLLEPQVLFKYPPGRTSTRMEKDLAAFCFPGGVEAHLMERTPSMSDLNEVVFGQEHLARDDSSFIFCLKASDNTTLYGVCLHVKEIVQRAPGILGAILPLSQTSSKSSRFLVSAPRCYCLLTRVPFFELHYEMLNSVISQERLERIMQFVSDMSLTDYVPRGVNDHDQLVEDVNTQNMGSSTNWMDSAIPVAAVLGLTTPSSRKISDKDISSFSFRMHEPESPESGVTSEASDFAYTKELDKDGPRSPLYIDDFASESSESRCDSFERPNGIFENGQISPTIYCSSHKLERIESLESIYSSVRSMRSDCEDDEVISKSENVISDKKVIEWAKENNNEALQIICRYHSLPVPSRGSEIIFHPLDHLQPFRYNRPGVSSLGLSGTYSDVELSYPSEVDEVNARLGAAEEALALSIWTTATICRALSLESILALFAGALLEKQIVVTCPNLGILSATILSLVPMIRPFEWQSLLLPVLPRKMFDFLDAPVPYIVGIQHKPADLKIKTSNLLRVDVCKDQVKMCYLPPLPRYKDLVSELSSFHTRLSCEDFLAKRHPVYRCSEVQAEAAHQFLSILRNYLESLCSNLRSHTITNVQSSNDRVSLLLKESFIDSFPNRDRPFIKLFVDTQMFSVLSDSRLLMYENESL